MQTKSNKAIKILSELSEGDLFKVSDYSSVIYVKGKTVNQKVVCYTYNTGGLNTSKTFYTNQTICTKFNL